MKDEQRVTAIDMTSPGNAPGQVPASPWTTPLPKWLVYTLAGLMLLAAWMVVPNWQSLDLYWPYFRNTAPVVRMRAELLSQSMDERAVQAHFPDIPLKCTFDASGMGERVCWSDTREVDGGGALTMALFFDRTKHLQSALVHVPMWSHGRVIAQFRHDHGEGRTVGGVTRWVLPNGFIQMNRNRSWNPLSHSTVLWTLTQ